MGSPTVSFLHLPFALKAKEVFLSPENNTILVSTAVEIAVGGKSIKPAGGALAEGTAAWKGLIFTNCPRPLCSQWSE